MKSRFHEEAETDLTEAVNFYDRKSLGLGDRLVAEVRAAVAFIEEYPSAAAVIAQDVRGKVLVRFPHALLYTIAESEIFILANSSKPRSRGMAGDCARPTIRPL